MRTIKIGEATGSFAENKDVARDIRQKELMPALARNEKIVLDFGGVEIATQSFLHALISEALREYGSEALGRIEFRSCTDTVKEIVGIVVDYMQSSFGADPPDA